MQLFFSDKIVVITGGSEGIGRALIEILIRLNAIVITCSRNEKKLKQLKSNILSDRLSTMVCDVSKKKDCQDFIKNVIQHHKKIDILINNAGISMRSEFLNTEISVFEKLIQTNFMGTVYCTHLALPHLIKSVGTIVGISSVAGYRATPGRSAYSASKFAMNGFLESLRLELINKNVNVLTIAPGFISSNIRFNALDGDGNLLNETTVNEKKIMSPIECATLILKAIMDKKKRLNISRLGKFTIWINKLFPKLADKIVYNYYYQKQTLIK